MEALPQDSPLEAVRAEIGDYRTLAFWAWADEAGKQFGRTWRRQVYIPKPSALDPDDSLVAAIGREGALAVCHLFGGQSVDLPNLRSVMRRQAQRYARELTLRGLTPVQIAEEISQEYQISPYQVRAWLKSAKP